MDVIYSRMDDRGHSVAVWGAASSAVAPRPDGGIYFRVGTCRTHVSDDDIPGLISALQNYMSRRAKELAKGTDGNR